MADYLPSSGLIAKLLDGAPFRSNQIHERDRWLIEEAYKAGADQELEACCECLIDWDWDEGWSDKLRAARRPKPPSLKEEALVALDQLMAGAFWSTTVTAESIIRRALEALDD